MYLKRTSNNLQNITQKTKDYAIQIPLKTGGEVECSGKVGKFPSATVCYSCYKSGHKSGLRKGHGHDRMLVVFITISAYHQ